MNEIETVGTANPAKFELGSSGELAIQENCVLVRIKTKCWSNVRQTKMPDSAIKAMAAEESPDAGIPGEQSNEERKLELEIKRRVKLSKSLIVCKEYTALASAISRARADLIKRFVVPSFIEEGLYLVRKDSLADLESAIGAIRAEIKEALGKFKSVYREAVEEARRVWNGKFNPDEYPGVWFENGEMIVDAEILDGLFGLGFAYWNISVPSGLPKEVLAREEEKMRQTYRDAQLKITEALYDGFTKLIGHLAERLSGDVDEKRRIFHKTTIGNILEFAESFSRRNLFDDSRLAEIVGKAEQVLKSIDGNDADSKAETIRTSDSVRASVFAKMEQIKSDLDSAMAKLPVRSFDFAD